MIFIVINKFTKQGYFIIYTKEILAEDIAQIYIKDYIRQRYQIYCSILGSLYSRIRNLSSNINSILPTNRWINKEVKLDIRAVLQVLY